MNEQNIELIDRYKLILGAGLDHGLTKSAMALLGVIVACGNKSYYHIARFTGKFSKSR